MQKKIFNRKKHLHIRNIRLLFLCLTLVVFCCAGCASDGWNGPQLHEQALKTDTVPNARQLGGYPAADGKRVKDSVLIRSGMLFDASAEDIEKLKEEYGLRVIIDLRTPHEIAEKPNPDIEGVVHYNLPLDLPLMGDGDDSTSQADIIEIYLQYGDDPGRAYLEMIRAGALSDDMYTAFLDSEGAAETWRQFFDILLEQEEGAVLWHCTGGKDRAGLTAAIVLSILGVDEETILADFTLSNEVLREKISYVTKEAAKYTSDEDELEQVASLVGVSADHMQSIFDRARAEAGSVSAFFQQKIGLSDEEVQLLRDRYLE